MLGKFIMVYIWWMDQWIELASGRLPLVYYHRGNPCRAAVFQICRTKFVSLWKRGNLWRRGGFYACQYHLAAGVGDTAGTGICLVGLPFVYYADWNTFRPADV